VSLTDDVGLLWQGLQAWCSMAARAAITSPWVRCTWARQTGTQSMNARSISTPVVKDRPTSACSRTITTWCRARPLDW
jgi:hypothetical protein